MAVALLTERNFHPGRAGQWRIAFLTPHEYNVVRNAANLLRAPNIVDVGILIYLRRFLWMSHEVDVRPSLSRSGREQIGKHALALEVLAGYIQLHQRIDDDMRGSRARQLAHHRQKVSM